MSDKTIPDWRKSWWRLRDGTRADFASVEARHERNAGNMPEARRAFERAAALYNNIGDTDRARAATESTEMSRSTVTRKILRGG